MSAPAKAPKFKQLLAIRLAGPNCADSLLGLDANGQVWLYNKLSLEWQKFPQLSMGRVDKTKREGLNA